MNAETTWNQLLEAFRALGGTADNIVFGPGPSGPALLPRDNNRAVTVRVPKHLMLSMADTEFQGDRLAIKATAQISTEARNFFELYESTVSRGADDGSQTMRFTASLDALPGDLAAILISGFGFEELFESSPLDRAKKHVLKRRSFPLGDRNVIVPFIELANYHPEGLKYHGQQELCIEGKVREEVLVSCATYDSFAVFCAFGIASKAPPAFSLPVTLKIAERELVVGRRMDHVVKRGAVWVPHVNVAGNTILVSHVMLGHPKIPRASRAIFRTIMREAGIQNSDEAFDLVLHANWTKFLALVAAMEPHGGEPITTIRKMAHFQLEALTHCVGAREL